MPTGERHEYRLKEKILLRKVITTKGNYYKGNISTAPKQRMEFLLHNKACNALDLDYFMGLLGGGEDLISSLNLTN